MKGRDSVSAWCIDHPVATILLTFALVLLGVIAFPKLPIAPLPEAEFPTIQVAAQLPGASPETMASSVATPLEVQFSAIPGVTQMTSSSALGSTNLTLQFTLDKSIDTAAQEVQAAINTASGKLPKDMPNLPTWRKVNPADSPVLILSINSTLLPGPELSDLVETLLAVAEGKAPGYQLTDLAKLDRIAGELEEAFFPFEQIPGTKGSASLPTPKFLRQ